MAHTAFRPHRTKRVRVGTGLMVLGVFVGLATLGGCGSNDAPAHRVTVTAGVSTPDPTETATPTPKPAGTLTPTSTPKPATTTPQPATTTPAVPLPGGMTLDVSKGGVSPSCTSSVCYFIHLAWSGLEKGSHQVQCVTEQSGVGVFSDNSYYFDATSGDRELKCFHRNTGDEVWVVIDGMYESNHVDWE